MITIQPNIKRWLCWYSDDLIKIEFSTTPKRTTLDYPPDATEVEVEDIDNKPYINVKELWVKITYDKCVSYFFIPKDYRWNGANIPRGCWYLIGSPDDPKFWLASMIHDWLCEHHEDARNDRYLSTTIFCSLCKVSKVKEWRITLMFHAVDNYQKVKGRDLKGDKWK